MIRQEECIVVGKVQKTHNLYGEVVIASDTDLLEKYADKPVFLLLEGAPVPFFISEEGLSMRNHHSYLVKFDLVDSQEEAEQLLGADVLVLGTDSDNVPAEPDIFDLVGFAVTDERSGAEGVVADVADYSGNIVFTLVIFGKEILLPLADDYLKQIDREEKKLVVFIPAEIADLY
ncbi:MAG: ribosome maturation factor RimM [Culturomica sp.]|jgi:16S rRNA processing protein RimM|nr:ribosome maturation factor RimM [Culturomica sp.]